MIYEDVSMMPFSFLNWTLLLSYRLIYSTSGAAVSWFFHLPPSYHLWELHSCVYCNFKLLSRGDSSAEGLDEVSQPLIFQYVSVDMEQGFCLLPTLPACPIQSSKRSVQWYSDLNLHTHTCTTYLYSTHSLFISLFCLLSSSHMDYSLK